MNSDKEQEKVNESKVVIYEDVSMERGAFLIQQAMRVIFLVLLERIEVAVIYYAGKNYFKLHMGLWE